ncbi:hypothetical protein GGI35DRAFT_484937 [Trichoderma velutinum]
MGPKLEVNTTKRRMPQCPLNQQQYLTQTRPAAPQSGHVTGCGPSVPPLTPVEIDATPTVVAQMGFEPFLNAMLAHPDFDIIIGGRAYDPAPVLGGFTHMGKIMECGGLCAVPMSKSAFATVYHDGSFLVRPLARGAVCTLLSVAAHALYEKSRPDRLAKLTDGITAKTSSTTARRTNGKDGSRADNQYSWTPSFGSTLGDVAKVIHSKNADPYQLTLDAIFEDQSMYDCIKSSGLLRPETIAQLYDISLKDIAYCGFSIRLYHSKRQFRGCVTGSAWRQEVLWKKMFTVTGLRAFDEIETEFVG